jgi:hypothetical protein
VTEQRPWPPEQSAKGTLRPWHDTAAGYLAVLFADPEEAQRAQCGLQQRGLPEGDLRLYDGEESCASRRACSRNAPSWPRQSRRLWSTTGQNSAGWATPGQAVPSFCLCPTKERANRMVGLLADYQYGSLDYFAEHGVEVIERDVSSASTGQGNDRHDPDDHSDQHSGL